jgi:ubiquinone biosynthesis protein
MLSTRRDLVPDEIALELAKLQDQVPPFSGELVRVIIEKAYGKLLENVFDEFCFQPLASASIAQVHSARLPSGREVVVKVVRPDIQKVIQRDIELLYIIANLTQRYWSEGHRLRPVEVVTEYEKTIFDELDLIREAANASQLRHNFQGSSILYVPEVFWSETCRNVLVMERIYGVPVSNIAELRRRNVNLKKLSERGVVLFFTQVFRDSFFHADMHPGNVFVNTEDPADPRYIAVDFGIIGTLSPSDQHYLAENFLAFFNRNYRRIAELHIESGWVSAGTRIDEFESAIRTVSEPIFGRPLKEISFGGFLLALFKTARRFNMKVQPQLLLLQKTLLNIEGLGRQLYPELDLWETAKPFLEKWMRDRIEPCSVISRMRSLIPSWVEQTPDLPGILYGILQKANSGQMVVQLRKQELEQLQLESRRSNRRAVAQIVFVVALVTGISLIIYVSNNNYLAEVGWQVPLLTWLVCGVGLGYLLGGVL